MMLAVAPVEDLWKKNFRLSRAEFDKIALRPDVSPDILSPNNRVLPLEKKVAADCIFFRMPVQ